MNGSPYSSFIPPYGTPYFPQYNPLKSYCRDLRKTANRLSWMVLAGIFSMRFLYALLQRILWMAGYPMYPNEFDGLSQEMYFLISCLYYIIGMFLPFFFFLLASRRSFNQTIPFRAFPFRLFFPCLFLGVAVCLLANYPASMVASLLEQFGFNASMPETPLPDSPIGISLYVLQIAVIPPLVEEFAFRGVIFSRLRKYGDGLAVVASALLFGLFHGNPIQLPFAFLCGLIFAFLVLRTQSLLLPILLHAINNGLSVACELLENAYGEAFVNLFYGIFFLSMLVLGILSLIFLAIKEKGFFRPAATHQPVRLATRFGMLFANPGAIALLLYCVGTSILFMLL